MALFVDGPLTTIDDLTAQDSGLLDVVLTCGINLTTKLRLAWEETDTDLRLRLDRLIQTAQLLPLPAVNIDQVVYTPPLKRWETMQALALTYRDAYFSQLVDRYQARWDEYSKLAALALDRFVSSGIGLVADPMPKAPAPILGSIAGPQNGGVFYASISWVNVAGQEGAASDPSSLTLIDGHLMTVSAAGAPANAIGFNVYAGTSLDGLTLQNNVALAVAGSFTYVPGATIGGPLAGPGQQPDFIRPLSPRTPSG